MNSIPLFFQAVEYNNNNTTGMGCQTLAVHFRGAYRVYSRKNRPRPACFQARKPGRSSVTANPPEIFNQDRLWPEVVYDIK